MPRSRINGNFIDKTFSIVANILLRIIPTTSGEKEAFTYYRDGAIWFFFLLLSVLRERNMIRDKKKIFEINLRLLKVKFGKKNNSFCRVSSINAASDALLQLSILVLSERLHLEVLYYRSILLH